MLQQTQVIKVIDYFNNFIHHFPSLEILAKANTEEVLACWSGLGYYNRARNLHKTAIICYKNYNGKLPKDFNKLIDLPGIGKTTAGAILSLASDLSHPILDGNVKRVMSRLFAIRDEKTSQLNKQLWQRVTELMPQNNCRKYNQALMDIGSLICTRSQPNCKQCPLINSCKAFKNDEIHLYPQTNKKTKQINKTYHLLFLKNNQNLLLQKRSSDSIWPQLWFLPMFESKSDLESFHLFHKDIMNANAKFSIQHILSHRKLDLQVYCFENSTIIEENNKQYQWVNISQYKKLPHPTALEKVIQYYLAHENITHEDT